MKPEYYIGIDMIDEEHKQLFKYADEAYELLHDEFTPDKYDRIDVILENLRNYTVKHFSDEEQYMESINYKKIFTQKVQHQEFIHKLDDLNGTPDGTGNHALRNLFHGINRLNNGHNGRICQRRYSTNSLGAIRRSVILDRMD